MADLFTLKSDPTIFGNIIGKNSAGLSIFEVRPTGEIRVINHDDLEEVVPYTITMDTGSSYEAKAGAFVVNDVLVLHGSFSAVKSINARNRKASALPSDTRRILTEAVGA